MKTILLTGATGYLGGYLSKSFLNQGFRLIALRLNQNDKFLFEEKFSSQVKTYSLDVSSPETVFKENKIDIVVHTAVLYGRNNESITDMLNANVAFPLKILSLCEKYCTELFINTDSILTPEINAYSMTKHNFVDWLSMYSDKVKIANIRLDHFYGPNDNPIKFIAWLIQEMKNNVEQIDLTDGNQTRDFIYIDDVVSAYSTVIANRANISLGQVNVFEVGTNTKTSIRQLVSLIYEKIKPTKTTLNFGGVPHRKNEMFNYDVNTTTLRFLGWTPQVTLAEGIEKILKTEEVIQ